MACSGPRASPTETVIRPIPGKSTSASRLCTRSATRTASSPPHAVHDDRELLAAEPADHVLRPDDRAQALGEEAQQLVADGVAVDVVDVLEVVDVQHEHRQRPVRAARLLQRLQQPLVEDAVVEEARERVGAGLMLEALSDLGVVERERGRVAEALRDLELRLAERDAVALAVDVQRALDLAARDERDADEGFGLHRRSGHGANARVEVRLVAQHSLAMARCPPGDALREADRRAHDLVGVHVPHEHRLEHALRLVGLVDRQRVERRNQVADGVGDAHQEGVEALLGEDLVEDVREPPVRLDEGRIAPRRVVVEQPEMAGPDYHRSPNRSQFRCTFETPRSGPQRTDEASVRGPGHESLVRVNTDSRCFASETAGGWPFPAGDAKQPSSVPAAATPSRCSSASSRATGRTAKGAPFVGPAGRVLDEALAQAGIDRQAVYVTNAVKHFKWEPRGKRRIHAKPSWSELAACRPWLEA